MSEIHQRLKEKILEQETIRKVCDHTMQLQARLKAEEIDLTIMEKTLAKEQRDVELLEQEGLSAMFYKFLGDREERIEKEREEYLKASLRFNELFKSVELIRFELGLLSKKSQNLESVKGQIEVLIQQREEELLNTELEVAIELRGIHEQTDKLHKYSVEVEQAYAAGLQALEYVRNAEKYLQDAQIWGQRDLWGSRNYRSGEMKHQAIDHARQMAYQSRHYLIAFSNELKDVYDNMDLQFNIEIGEFSNFGDVFFDNLISDWMTQQKIIKTLAGVTNTRMQIENAMHQLDQERGIIRNKLNALEQRRRKTIVNSGE